MFVFMILGVLLCVSLIVIIKSQHIYGKRARRVTRIVSCIFVALILVASVAEVTAYIKGGLKAVETKANISYVNIGKNADFFNVNGKYWSIHGNDIITGRIMLTARNPKNTDIRFVPAESLLQKQFIVSYLPISRYIIKMQVPITDGNNITTNYDCFSSERWSFENKIACAVLIIAVLCLIRVIVSSIIDYFKCKKRPADDDFYIE